jgi:hypothetical protein
MGFGSPHPHAGQFVYSDGSVHQIPYDIDPIMHWRLGNRADKHVIQGNY